MEKSVCAMGLKHLLLIWIDFKNLDDKIKKIKTKYLFYIYIILTNFPTKSPSFIYLLNIYFIMYVSNWFEVIRPIRNVLSKTVEKYYSCTYVCMYVYNKTRLPHTCDNYLYNKFIRFICIWFKIFTSYIFFGRFFRS